MSVTEFLNRTSDTFGITLLFFVLALFVVGIPAAIVKIGSTFLIRPNAPNSRRVLSGRSISAALVTGFVAILAYFAISVFAGTLPSKIGQLLPGEIGSIAILVIIPLTADLWIWRAIEKDIAAKSALRFLAWMSVSNVWVLWAACVLWLWGSFTLSHPCDVYSSDMERAGIDSDACSANPRRYWAEHPELWNAAEEAARHGNCPDCDAD